jgi:uncharacterized protein DUF11
MGFLLVGGTATFTISGIVDPDATGTLVNQATVTGPINADPNPGNNTATDTTEIIPPHHRHRGSHAGENR